MTKITQAIQRRLVHKVLDIASSEWVLKCVVVITATHAKLRLRKQNIRVVSTDDIDEGENL